MAFADHQACSRTSIAGLRPQFLYLVNCVCDYLAGRIASFKTSSIPYRAPAHTDKHVSKLTSSVADAAAAALAPGCGYDIGHDSDSDAEGWDIHDANHAEDNATFKFRTHTTERTVSAALYCMS